MKGHTRGIEDLVMDEEGRLVSSSSDLSIRLWNTERGIEVASLRGHLTSVYGLEAVEGGIWSGKNN